MFSQRLIHLVQCHAEGEIGHVITGGVAPPPGETLWDQARWIATDDRLRRLVLNEPRGHVATHVNLLVPPKHPDAAMGFIIMEPVHTPPMSGSNSLCVATVLLETGMVPMIEPLTQLTLEAPGGLVPVTAACAGGRVQRVSVDNLPSFAAGLDLPLSVPGLGRLSVDIAFGGDSFVMVRAADAGVEIAPDQAHRLVARGREILAAANQQLRFHHPDLPDWRHISFCLFHTPVIDGPEGLETRQAVIIEPGKVDRSPTGTGLSAHMAVRHARGQMRIGERLIARSIIDGRFDGELLAVANLSDGTQAVRPRLSGRAWIAGLTQLLVDPLDPWPEGYRLSDTWPNR